MHELDSARLKLKRANIHINALNRSIKRFLAAGKNVIISDADFEGINQVYQINPVSPVSWGLMAGDALTNLRASLDHIVWALALKQGTPQFPRRIQFPIFEASTDYQDRGFGAPRMLAEVLPTAHSQIEGLQPYHSVNWPEPELLRVLNILVNLDKHRILTQTFLKTGIIIHPAGQPDFDVRKRYLVIITDRLRQRLAEQNLNPEFTFEVAFVSDDPAVDGYRVEYLTLIHQFIRDEVIPRFARFF